jgi:hypothetical protein
MFVVASDLDAEKAAPYEKAILEVETALYATFMTNRPDYIIRVLIFKDQASLQANAKKVREVGIVMPGGGFYMEYEKALFLDSQVVGVPGLKHELTHALERADFGRSRPAPWFDEGFATMIESADLGGKEIKFHFDFRLLMLDKLLKDQKLPKLKDVLTMEFAAYNAFPARMIGDAVSRNLLMYLSEKGLLVKFYQRYRGNVGKDRTGVKSIEEVCGKKIDEVDAEWRTWLAEKLASDAVKKDIQGAKTSMPY